MKKFGIYLAYPPTVDLRAEGLGRHLAEFLKGARGRDDVRFVIACPSWLCQNLLDLFDASGVHRDEFELIAPPERPLLLRLHERYVAWRRGSKRARQDTGLRARLRRYKQKRIRELERRLVRTRSVASMAGISISAVPLFLLVVALRIADQGFGLARRAVRRILGVAARLPAIREANARVENRSTPQPPGPSLAARLFADMEESETNLMQTLIEARRDVTAWYSPTAFWPQFNALRVPRLMCVPDVVLTDFPVGFAPVGGERFLENFQKVEKSIEGGEYFVTYSEDVKWRTLTGHYFVDPERIFVVPHGVNRLDDLVTVSGLADGEMATDRLCRELFRRALRKAVNFDDARIFAGGDVRFLFYASQFRPNKNVLTLLRAYEHLLKRRYVGHKLILTGHPEGMPELQNFLRERKLENDVLCLNGLSAQELAACYRLADLAVNPSLSEGGCPFTFTEALSLGTPVAMARITVTEEVITDPELQAMMLFDPFDWNDMANRIEWALGNLDELHARQKPFFDSLSRRSWREVVDDHIAILERISSSREMTQDAEVQGFDDSGVRRTCA